jgi:subtilisin family serine protease
VRHTGGPRKPFHVVALGAYLGHVQSAGSIPFPGDGPEVVCVGAVDESGRRASYSSCGPNSARPKPDLTAVVPFPSQWRAKSFGGTSAAAPQAAAAAALCWAARPAGTAADVRRALASAARDLGPAGHDFETGFGQLMLPRVPAAR